MVFLGVTVRALCHEWFGREIRGEGEQPRDGRDCGGDIESDGVPKDCVNGERSDCDFWALRCFDARDDFGRWRWRRGDF